MYLYLSVHVSIHLSIYHLVLARCGLVGGALVLREREAEQRLRHLLILLDLLLRLLAAWGVKSECRVLSVWCLVLRF